MNIEMLMQFFSIMIFVDECRPLDNSGQRCVAQDYSAGDLESKACDSQDAYGNIPGVPKKRDGGFVSVKFCKTEEKGLREREGESTGIANGGGGTRGACAGTHIIVLYIDFGGGG